MANMRESCVVTIQPSISDDGIERLNRAIIDKLWPGNAGGIHLFAQMNGSGKMIAALAREVRKRGAPLMFRAIRNGIKISIEPA